jgi:molybdopterin biosynthesis enzyme MoaB
MKIAKMLKKLKAFIDNDVKQQEEQKWSIKIILKNLKKKQHKLKVKLKHEPIKDKREAIEKELDIIFVQRKKGIKALKALQQEE